MSERQRQVSERQWHKERSDFYLQLEVAALLDDAAEVARGRAQAYAAGAGTGGVVPRAILPMLMRAWTPEKEAAVVGQLLAAGIWVQHALGWEIVDFYIDQDQLVGYEARKASDRERKRRQRDKEKTDAASRDTPAEGAEQTGPGAQPPADEKPEEAPSEGAGGSESGEPGQSRDQSRDTSRDVTPTEVEVEEENFLHAGRAREDSSSTTSESAAPGASGAGQHLDLPGELLVLGAKLNEHEAIRGVRWDRLSPQQLEAIAAQHRRLGDDAMVAAALRSVRQHKDPPIMAQGWLTAWEAWPTPKPKVVPLRGCHVHPGQPVDCALCAESSPLGPERAENFKSVAAAARAAAAPRRKKTS